jgi:putative ABC transport system permease protein
LSYKNYKIPKFAGFLLNLALPDADNDFLKGDYEEIFSRLRSEKGKLYSNFWIWKQIFKSTPIYIYDSIYWGVIMIRNYLKITWRNITKYKTYSAINITGLATGIACFLLILLYVSHELSYDNFHKKGDRIYRIVSHSTIGGTTRYFAPSPGALSETIAQTLPEIESFVRIFDNRSFTFTNGGMEYNITGMYFVDSTFFQIFTHEFIAGNPETALAAPNTIVLTEKTAYRIFGTGEAYGKVLTTQGQNPIDFQVTGIIKNVPDNSHYDFNAVISTGTLVFNSNGNRAFLEQDYYFDTKAYLLLKPDANVNEVESKIMEVVDERWGKMLSVTET